MQRRGERRRRALKTAWLGLGEHPTSLIGLEDLSSEKVPGRRPAREGPPRVSSSEYLCMVGGLETYKVDSFVQVLKLLERLIQDAQKAQLAFICGRFSCANAVRLKDCDPNWFVVPNRPAVTIDRRQLHTTVWQECSD